MNNYKQKKLFCQNCNSKKHFTKDCIHPKKSVGIILFTNNNDTIKFLMIKRRNTIGFVQFMRGQYIKSDIKYIQELFNVMTNYEIDLIFNSTFDILWEYLWLDTFYSNKSDKVRKDKLSSSDKFSDIKKGYYHNNLFYDLTYFKDNKCTFYTEPEWGFPKGRQNINETEIETAIREFCEETGIEKKKIIFLNDKPTFKEEYKSYDNADYRNVYFICKYNSDNYNFNISPACREQYTEVSKIEFLDIQEANLKIRDYSIYKKNLLNEVYAYVKKYLEI